MEKYKCVEDLQGTDFMVGKSMDLGGWKKWLLDQEIERLYMNEDLLNDEDGLYKRDL